jgi:hypothetical protein
MDKETKSRLDRIERTLAGLAKTVAGVGPTLVQVDRKRKPEEDPNYIAHGSDAHAALLGLVEVTKANAEDVERLNYVTLQSADGRTWHLADEEAAIQCYSNAMEPKTAIARVLRQKLNVLEAGKPPIPEDAPPPYPLRAGPTVELPGVTGPIRLIDDNADCVG